MASCAYIASSLISPSPISRRPGASTRSAETGGCVQLVTADATSPEDSVASVLVDDVESAYAEALRLGYEIVRPLTTEEWGVHRFLVRAPDGNVLNFVEHPN